jgi:flagellar basal-body rod protein FlgB
MMEVPPVIDPLFGTVEYALGGLQMRTEAAARDIANANTPNYRSTKVSFEKNLADALASGKEAPARAPEIVGGSSLPNGQGNSVSLETELTDVAKTALGRQTLVNAFNYKIALIKTAVGK